MIHIWSIIRIFEPWPVKRIPTDITSSKDILPSKISCLICCDMFFFFNTICLHHPSHPVMNDRLPPRLFRKPWWRRSDDGPRWLQVPKYVIPRMLMQVPSPGTPEFGVPLFFGISWISSGKLSHGKIHHAIFMGNSLFRLGHFQVREVLVITRPGT